MVSFNFRGSLPPGCSGPPEEQPLRDPCEACEREEGTTTCDACSKWVCMECAIKCDDCGLWHCYRCHRSEFRTCGACLELWGGL